MKKLITVVLAIMMMLSVMVAPVYACSDSCECESACACTDTSTDGSCEATDADGEEILAEFTLGGHPKSPLRQTQVTRSWVTQCGEHVAYGDFVAAGSEDCGGKVVFNTFVDTLGDGGVGMIFLSYPNEQEVELFSGGHFVMPSGDPGNPQPLVEAEGVEILYYHGETLYVYLSDKDTIKDRQGLEWVVFCSTLTFSPFDMGES